MNFRFAMLAVPLAACGQVACSGYGSETEVREDFRSDLSILTYQNQCPDVSPPVLQPQLNKVLRLKADLKARIRASKFKSELDASQRESDEIDKMAFEVECIGEQLPNSDADAVKRYGKIAADQIAELEALNRKFEGLLERSSE